MKKRILSFIIAAVLLLQIAAIPNVSAAGVTLEGNYTFIDTCHSPVNGGTYVAVAKDFTNTASEPAKIYVSQNGEDWTEARTFSQSKHYAFPSNRQTVVWWEKEQKFVTIMLNHLWFSADGYTWEMVPKEIYERSNAMIATNGQQLAVLAKASILVFDDLEHEPVVIYGIDKTPGNNTYGKTIGVSPEEPYMYVATDQYKIWLCDSRKEPDPGETKSDAAQLTENIGALPYDMEWVSGFEGWVTVNGKAVLRVVNNADKPSYSVLNDVPLSDGTTNSEGFTAVGASEDNVVLGTEKGKLYIAPNDKEVLKGNIPFTVIEPGYKIDSTEEIRSISAVDEKTFFAVSTTKIYLIMQEDDGVWRFYDVGGSNIELENDTRFEIPASGSYTTTFAPVNYDYKGNVSSDNLVSFDLISELPDGITSEKLSDTSVQFTIDSTTSGGHEIKYQAVTESGKTKEFVITVVDEDHIEITGNDNMVIPFPGDEAERYEYSFEIIGTDGSKMDRGIVVDVIEMPEGASFDSSSNTFIIDEKAQVGEIVFTVSSAVKPENKVEKRINVSKRKPVRIEFDEAPDALYIPYENKALYRYSAKLYDQTDRELADEKAKWSVEAKDIPSMDGIIMKETGEISLESSLQRGVITVTAVSETDAELIIQKDVKLNYTDRRIVDDDFAQFSIDTSVPAEGKLPLASRGPMGSTIKWRSTDENIITTDGTVIRPSREDKKVTLTGVWKYNTATIERKYEFLVKKAETLCVNGDLNENSTKGWSPKGDTELSVVQESGKNVLKSSGTGAYQTIKFTNDSSYGFNARVKAPANGKIRLMSEKVGKIAEITANGQYQDIKASYNYKKQKNSFEDKIYLEYTGDLLIDELKVYEITLELNAAAAAVNKAVYSKKEKDINDAADLLNAFYDLPVRDELREKLENINSSSGGSSGSGGSGGGGGGGGSSSKNHSTAPSAVIPGNNTNVIPTPVKKDDNTADELDTYLLKFKDMKGHWARADVEHMAELGVITGDGNDMFRPDDEVSRAEFAAMITRAMGLEPTAYENSFFDVVSGDWYSGYVQTVRSNNYMNGYDGLFKPNEAITREELAKVIVAAYNAKTNTKLETGKTLYFNDLDNISYWAYDYIVEAADMGFINGMTEELFAPKQHATRAQTAVMLKRVCDKLNPAQ